MGMDPREPVVVDVVRTAFGKRKGALAGWHPTDLLGFTLKTLLDGQLWTQFRVAQVLADRWKISREEMDEYAVESHRRAHEATTSGHFAKELVPVPVRDADGNFTGDTLDGDEGIRPDSNLDAL